MKYFLIFCLMCFGIQAGKIDGAWPVEVIHVIDGDTIKGRIDLGDGFFATVNIRLKGIDAPELSGRCDEEIHLANQAKSYLEDLIPVGSQLILKAAEDGKYRSRVLGDLYLGKKNLKTILLKQKFIRQYNGKKRKGWCD